MDLKIDFSSLEQTSASVKNKADEFQLVLNKIKKLNEDLKNYWAGTDASSYAVKVEEQANVMQELSDKISEIGVFLQKVKSAYEEAQENNTIR